MTAAPASLAARYDAVVVGGGHNGLTTAAYLARAGRSVLLLERLDHVGGASVSAPVFEGVDARLSRYSYLVSLMPRQLVDELGLSLTLRRRRFSSYTPVGDAGLLVDTASDDGTRASFAAIGAPASDHDAWQRFYGAKARLAERLFPTVTEPLLSAKEARALVDDDEVWRDVVERPLGETLRARFADDVVRGVVATDGLIGTFADLDETSLVQNRCFLYHVVGGGTGDWDVPVGGMGAVSGALRDAALAAGATIVTGADVTAVSPGAGGAEVAWTDGDGRTHGVSAGVVVAGCAPATLDALLAAGGAAPSGTATPDAPEGAQLKVNMLLRRLPRLRGSVDTVDPVAAFSGTFHVNESFDQLQTAYAQAAAGQIPDLPPCEIYCHSLTDPSILGASLRDAGAQTLTLFGLHMPARLFRSDNDGAREEALAATLRSLDSVLAEPISDVLLHDAEGRPCIEARTPVDLEGDVGLPGGHIFHRDLSWPWAESDDEAGRWGVETAHAHVLLGGAGARRGGGVSGIPGRAAAMAVLDR
ncbi:NAD(P)/FAD-dependent oxidoreductase [Isoptericola variabilis]|uniref:FAD dependent oxidoreductase n=1 Tax=Isoptericola variabilis (strain 225) TaxID=743718 RepID=F6FQ06_ISOV2|nr:NAD(P)/FAD-dependent oxidoreductase [Isoptericola variabilis]AEG44812.1 FAD dependent oxidoreductase [Isoptericola variabilis 225]TWH30698.1 phytoene dehydrogenase-like protein [Isoptericola variabilis J7]